VRERLDYWVFGVSVVLVLITLVGVIAAFRTLKAIEHQLVLQNAAMKQWVELKPLSSRENNGKLEVSFDLKNPTNFLMILNQVEIEFTPVLTEKYFLPAKHTYLPPRDPPPYRYSFAHQRTQNERIQDNGNMPSDTMERGVHQSDWRGGGTGKQGIALL
jgi:hypothetical protein